MKNSLEIKKVALAAMLTALSVTIDVFFKYVLSIQNFGLPFYAIPLVLGSIILGPFYGAIMGFVGDAIGVTLAQQGYLPMFAFAPILWGFIPGLFLNKSYKVEKLAYVLLFTYILASLSNTFAIFIHFGRATALLTIILRMSLIPFNTVIMFFFTKDIYKKLEPFYDQFYLKEKNLKA
jgi:riboflavin transporter